jgi:hypothetical protein
LRGRMCAVESILRDASSTARRGKRRPELAIRVTMLSISLTQNGE